MIYILIPTYNEEGNVEELQRRLRETLIGKDVFYLFVDDNSSDKTCDKLKSLFSYTPQFHIISKPQNQGPGDSFDQGFEWILQHSKSDKDIVVTMEADNTSDINLLNKMIAIAEMNFDLVLASVYAQGGGFSKTSFFRKVISFFANMLFRAIFNIKVLTLSSFYRAYRITLLTSIKQRYSQIISEKGFICMLEILLKSISVNATVVELPMVLRSDMRKGKSKMKIFKTVVSYVIFLSKNMNRYSIK